jgi:hypothetical protein
MVPMERPVQSVPLEQLAQLAHKAQPELMD